MKMLKKVFAVVLAVVIGITASVNTFAASAKKTYISDIVAVTAKDEADAKAQLEKDGYKLLANSNVNSTLKTGVYIGYKETDNGEEAITDIAGMNMTGKFSYSDYKTIMEQNREKIKETIDNFEPVIAEFQANYEEEKPSALAAYEALNTYKDDDSGKLMGDYLLGYDFSEASQKKMTDTFMQANSQIILTIMQQAAFAADDADDTLIERMAKTGPDGISKRYRGLYPSVAKANQAMAAEYGDTAAVIYNGWSSVYNYISEVEKHVTVDENGDVVLSDEMFNVEKRTDEDYKDIDDEDVKEYAEVVDTVADMSDITADEIDFSLYNLLSMNEYGDGTLLDFFKRPVNEVKKEELYPLVDAMSEGQRSQIEMNGLLLTLEGAFSDIEKDSEEAEKAVEKIEDVTETFGEISIYTGVDRSVFEDGVAFTSAAAEHETLTGESWLSELGIDNEKDAWFATIIATSFVSGVLIAACITASFIQKSQKASAFAPLVNSDANFMEKEIALKNFENFVKGEGDVYNGILRKDWNAEKIAIENRWLTDRRDTAQKILQDNMLNYDPTAGRIAGVVKCVSFVLLVVALAADAYAIYKYITTPKAVEEAVPHHIMATATTPYGEDYVYYQTVKNLNGEAQDTNNHEADAKIGWLVIYTTKDAAAGDPILADNLKLQKGSSDFREGTSFVHLFNETSALNLTAELYTGVKDSANGTYLVFDRDTSTLIGSAVTNGTAAIIGAGGLAVGAVLGALITKLAGKKKKEKPVEV